LVVRQAGPADEVSIPDHRDQMDRLPLDVVQEMASVPDEAPPAVQTAAGRDSALLQRERQAEQEQPASKVALAKLARSALPPWEPGARMTARR